MSKFVRNEKPRLGILPIAKINQYQGNIWKYIEVAKETLGKDEDIEIMIPDEPLFELDRIMENCAAMEKANCDMFLFVIGSWMYTSLVTTAVNSLNGKPCVMYGLCDEIANGSLGVSVQIRYVMEEMKLPFIYMYGKIDDKERTADIKKALQAAWSRNDIFGRSIALIGGKCMMMYQTQVNEFNWKKVFGIDFPQYDHVEIFKELENIDEEKAQTLARQFVDNCRQVNWNLGNGEKINEDAVISQMRLYLAYKRFQELYDVDMFATKCMPELVNKCYGYSYGACLATALLNEEESTIAACEGDIPAGIAMYILKKLAHAPVMFADISRLNAEEGVMNFFNCGSGPVSMASDDGYKLWPIPPLVPDEAVAKPYLNGDSGGACIEFEFEGDRTVTLLRLGGNDETLRFHAAVAKTALRVNNDNEDPNNSFAGGTRWPGCGIKLEDPDSFLRNATGHHYAIVYGDYAKELEYMTQFYGVKFVLDH